MDSLYERMPGRTVDGVEPWQKFRVDQTDERFDKIGAAPPAARHRIQHCGMMIPAAIIG